MDGRWRPLAVTALLALLAAGQLLAGAAPLTNVDIVRMVMAGLPDSTIIERIRSGPSAFETAPEILHELREAGVSEEVIAEMIARSPAAAAPPPPGDLSGGKPGFLELILEVDPGKEPASSSIVAPARAAPLILEEGPRISEEPGEAVPVSLAFVVTCAVSTHVPDHWSSQSRVGRLIGRHREVFFQEATAPVPGQEQFVYLAHPGRWRIPMEPGTHRGHMGGAVRTGGDGGEYLELYVVPYEGLVIRPGAATRVTLRMTSPGPKRRSRRGFLKRGDGKRPESLLGDPRLRPRVALVEVGHPGDGAPGEGSPGGEAGAASPEDPPR